MLVLAASVFGIYSGTPMEAAANHLDLAQKQMLHRPGEVLTEGLAEEEEKVATANLAVILARLELAKARLALE